MARTQTLTRTLIPKLFHLPTTIQPEKPTTTTSRTLTTSNNIYYLSHITNYTNI